MADQTVDLSIVLPLLHSAAALDRFMPQLEAACAQLPSSVVWEVIVTQPPGDPVAPTNRIKVVPRGASYGANLAQAVKHARGQFILSLEPEDSHHAFVVPELYHRRNEGDLLVASRFMRSGYSNAAPLRRYASRCGNAVLSFLLDLPVSDLTSSFRICHRRIFDKIQIPDGGTDVLLRTLVDAHAQGFRLGEIPFHHFPTDLTGSPGLFQIAHEIGANFRAMWRLRNSIDCADYDERAFRGRIWLQRSWQRRRYHAIVRMAREYDRILDVGCGSSQILNGLPQSDGCDIRMNKLRYKSGTVRSLVRASVFALPYRTGAYDAVVFSQVIEHLPRDPTIIKELLRVTRPGGCLIIGTPDYATWWTTIEKIYGFVHPTGYADEHITHYTFDTLKAEFEAAGCTYIEHAYVWKAELIMKFRKELDSGAR